jgi:hypothetical protein
MRREGDRNTGGGCFLSVLSRVFCSQERREAAAGKETAIGLKAVAGQVAELNRPAPLHDVRFRTISLDRASEKLAGS